MRVGASAVRNTPREQVPFPAASSAPRQGTRLVEREPGVRPVTLALSVLLCVSCDRDRRLPENVRDDLCSRSWWRHVTRSEVVQQGRTHGVGLNAVCDDEGNAPLHLALSAEGILSEDGFYAIAAIARSGADLFAVNTAGESAVTLAEGRFQRMLARWDRDMQRLCEDVDVLDQAVQRERWEPQWTGQNRPFVGASKPAISSPRLELRSTSRRPRLARCLLAR